MIFKSFFKRLFNSLCIIVVVVLVLWLFPKPFAPIIESASRTSMRSTQPLVPISVSELQSEMRMGASMILFVSSDTCSISRSFEPFFYRYLRDHQISVRHLNLSKEPGNIDFAGLRRILGQTGSYVPVVYAIRRGQVIDTVKHMNKEGLDEFFRRYGPRRQVNNAL